MTAHTPTAEQVAIIDAYGTGGDLVVEAGAGTGKTSTLVQLAEAHPRRGLYLAYNKAIADDARGKFPRSVECRTAHSLAYAAVGRDYRHRLNGPRVTGAEAARALRINDPVKIGDRVLSPMQLGRLAQRAVGAFAHSRDDEVGTRHVVVPVSVTDNADRAALRSAVLPYACRAWDDICSARGKLRFTHDHYLKLWQLSRPVLPADVVYLDEAQDANPAVAAIVEGHQGQRVMVGDRCQAIYGWRGAVDAMSTFPGERLVLSRSWRFGDAIAAEANKWLSILDSPLRLSGNPAARSTVGPVDEPDAVLCRTNARALIAVLNAYEANQRPALVGGGGDLRALAEAAIELRAGRGCSHPELAGFQTWADVVAFASDDEDGSDLAASVKIIDRWGAERVVRLLRGLTRDESRADVVVSTAHRAKGREWPRVAIADDFPAPRPSEDEPDPTVSPADAMLAYVAVTRARQQLDRAGLAWVDGFVSAPAGVAA